MTLTLCSVDYKKYHNIWQILKKFILTSFYFRPSNICGFNCLTSLTTVDEYLVPRAKRLFFWPLLLTNFFFISGARVCFVFVCACVLVCCVFLCVLCFYVLCVRVCCTCSLCEIHNYGFNLYYHNVHIEFCEMQPLVWLFKVETEVQINYQTAWRFNGFL
jgi:hypothetical protein